MVVSMKPNKDQFYGLTQLLILDQQHVFSQMITNAVLDQECEVFL